MGAASGLAPVAGAVDPKRVAAGAASGLAPRVGPVLKELTVGGSVFTSAGLPNGRLDDEGAGKGAEPKAPTGA